jgi:hypothetical protein
MPPYTPPSNTLPLPLAVGPHTAATLIGSTESSLEKDRAVGHLGIPYVKAGKRVIYCLSDLKDWLSTNKVTPSVQAAEGDQS